MALIYLDTSALLKRYIQETGSHELNSIWDNYEYSATSLVTKAEMGAALAKVVRHGVVDHSSAQEAWKQFLMDWQGLTLVRVDQKLVNMAADLTWQYPLRGFEAIQLASALSWQDLLEEPVTFATFDHRLCEVARLAGIFTWSG
jgi:predicted nucleic acid-binding protein